jgi:hypothetical protein
MLGPKNETNQKFIAFDDINIIDKRRDKIMKF